MTHQTRSWTDHDLDTVLAALGRNADGSPTEEGQRLNDLRDRVFGQHEACLHRRADTRDRPVRRGRRTGLFAGGVATALLATGGVAAATGYLDGLAARAFRNTTNGTADSGQPVRRFSTNMPDGGRGTIELWSAPSNDGDPKRLCLSLVTDTPEERPVNKPWLPQALCNPLWDGVWLSGGHWKRPGSSQPFHEWDGYILGAHAVEISDLHGHKVVVPTQDGYFIAFLPDSSAAQDESSGVAAIFADGTRRVLLPPTPAPTGG